MGPGKAAVGFIEQLYGQVVPPHGVVLVGLHYDMVERTFRINHQERVTVSVGKACVLAPGCRIDAIVGHEAVQETVHVVVILYLVNVKQALVHVAHVIKGFLIHALRAYDLGHVHPRVMYVRHVAYAPCYLHLLIGEVKGGVGIEGRVHLTQRTGQTVTGLVGSGDGHAGFQRVELGLPCIDISAAFGKGTV